MFLRKKKKKKNNGHKRYRNFFEEGKENRGHYYSECHKKKTEKG